MYNSEPIGLKRGTVTLKPYDPAWIAAFEQEKAILLDTLGDRIVGIEHIGSTSVPGLRAKPIIDMNLALQPNTIPEAIPLLEKLGYTYMPDRVFADRVFLPKGPEACRTHHLNLVSLDSQSGWEDPLLFRDYLHTHPDTAQEYTDLKETLAKQYPDDRATYTRQKHAFIKGVLDTARHTLR